uniref:Large ribosomal subunit protein eL14 domain-containing protein n=1 Tax=Coccolithus braarudii TaxID=221442 RepID=A0A7S0KZ50_9EUKA|eukprot:CAMPEP_0183350416 /NCGR_PEP_ID=MMETSP0164_2-20130417/18481_1 /TAXON_ID=221442 /ORGANISM="Coccolithus pelagicus ssp braarudi, Strain PLY182g" /LENGTH=144 /DNA_ID=CAMNT_0025522323 /DNA_START=64 /DNA_END=498 /DNA_ORIENTATION=-
MPALQNFIEIGRVCLVNYGDDVGSLCTILDVIDQNTALVDGPAEITGVARQVINFKRLSVTGIRVKIGRGARAKALKKAWKVAKVEEQFEKTAMSRKLKSQAKRRNLSDFDRFRVMLARKKKAALINKEFGKLRKAANKAAMKK